jgi:hypothetical protein
MTRDRPSWRLLTLLALVAGMGCLDSIVRELGPENDEQVINTPARFEFSATDLRNVNDQVTWVWPNSAPVASFKHNSFIHHGYGIVIITDAAGTMVDSTLLELNLDAETKAGVPGDWTIRMILASARGRVDFTLEPKP